MGAFFVSANGAPVLDLALPLCLEQGIAARGTIPSNHTYCTKFTYHLLARQDTALAVCEIHTKSVFWYFFVYLYIKMEV